MNVRFKFSYIIFSIKTIFSLFNPYPIRVYCYKGCRRTALPITVGSCLFFGSMTCYIWHCCLNSSALIEKQTMDLRTFEPVAVYFTNHISCYSDDLMNLNLMFKRITISLLRQNWVTARPLPVKCMNVTRIKYKLLIIL